MQNHWPVIYIVIILHQDRSNHVTAGPPFKGINRFRTNRDVIEVDKGASSSICVVGDIIYSAGEIVPGDQACLKCRCQPPGVHCDTIRCVKKPGCRAIHKPNKCCPDYECECEHEGLKYANGERLKTSKPGDECRVCYCRGGEIQCAQVTCFLRTDCEPQTVPGQCCPKYEHCPLLLKTPTISTSEIPQITIHEIIPFTNQEIPYVPDTDDTLNSISNGTDPEAESSEIRQVFEAPPPSHVLKIGEKLLFLEESPKVITVIGAEGLQPGGTDDLVVSNEEFIELNTASSTHILSLVKRRKAKIVPSTTIISTQVLDTNPAYPPIPDDFGTIHLGEDDIDFPTLIEESPKILTEVLEVRNNNSLPQNISTNVDWLKNGGGTLMNFEAILPEEILNQTASSDVIETTTIPITTTSSSTTRGYEVVEITEEEEPLVISEENVNNTTVPPQPIQTTTISSTTTTTEEINTQQTMKSKRENDVADETDEVFRQLTAELDGSADKFPISDRSEAEEAAESQQVFAELLAETNGTRKTPDGPKTAEAQALQKVTDAIARLALGGGRSRSLLDSNILGVLNEFFNTQYQQYNRKDLNEKHP